MGRIGSLEARLHYSHGAAFQGGEPVFEHVLFKDNIAEYNGGGSMSRNFHAVYWQCRFEDNIAEY
ncbi:MAG: hypothetical protein R6V85_01860, partial [Polyangia bacterium]